MNARPAEEALEAILELLAEILTYHENCGYSRTDGDKTESTPPLATIKHECPLRAGPGKPQYGQAPQDYEKHTKKRCVSRRKPYHVVEHANNQLGDATWARRDH